MRVFDRLTAKVLLSVIAIALWTYVVAVFANRETPDYWDEFREIESRLDNLEANVSELQLSANRLPPIDAAAAIRRSDLDLLNAELSELRATVAVVQSSVDVLESRIAWR